MNYLHLVMIAGFTLIAMGKRLTLEKQIHNLYVAFLSPDLVMPGISCGSEFLLWESGFVGEGVITDISPEVVL